MLKVTVIFPNAGWLDGIKRVTATTMLILI